MMKLKVNVPHRPEIGKLYYVLVPDVPIKKQVRPVCEQIGVEHVEYRFAYEEDGHVFYLTDENRGVLNDGDTILLMRSPTLLAQTSKNNLDSYNKVKALNSLEKHIRCPKFVERFIAIEGVESLVKAISGGHFNGASMNKALKIVDVLESMGVSTTNLYSEPFVKRTCAELKPVPEHMANFDITLKVLSSVARSMPDEVFRHLPLDHLAGNLTSGSIITLQYSLELVNTLMVSLHETDLVKFVKCILELGEDISEKLLLRFPQGYAQKDTTLHKPLSEFQTTLLRKRYLPLYRQRSVESHMKEFNNFIEHVLRTQLGWRAPSGRRYSDAVRHIGGAPEEYEDVLCSGEKCLISVRDIDGLTLHCLKYFERHHSLTLYPWMKEINILPLEYICPLLKSAIMLTDLIVDILHMDPTTSEGEESCVLRMFLTDFRNFFEELFSISLKLVQKTWREMRASSGDLHKVFVIVREQLTRAIENEMTCWSFDHFQGMLYATPYDLISQKLEAKLVAKEDTKRQDFLIGQLTPTIWQLVRQSKINKLVEGLDFTRINDRGSRMKNKVVTVRLANDRHLLRVILDHQTVSIPVAEIVRIDVMKQCNHFRKDDYSLTIVTSVNNLQSIQVATTEKQNFDDLWDSINGLLNAPLRSASARADFGLLIELELKLATIQLENIEIPTASPQIPDEPENYDF